MAKVQVTNVLDSKPASRRASFYKGVDVKQLDLSQAKARITDLKHQEAFAIEMEETNLAQRQLQERAFIGSYTEQDENGFYNNRDITASLRSAAIPISSYSVDALVPLMMDKMGEGYVKAGDVVSRTGHAAAYFVKPDSAEYKATLEANIAEIKRCFALVAEKEIPALIDQAVERFHEEEAVRKAREEEAQARKEQAALMSAINKELGL